MALPVLAADDDDLGLSFGDVRNMFRGGRRRRSPRGLGPASRPAPRYIPGPPASLQVAPGGVAPQPGIYPVGLEPFVFTNATGLSTITHKENPQINFRAQSMKVIVTRSAGAAAFFPLLVRGSIGIKQMTIGANPVPIEVFAVNATEVNILYPQTRPGNDYSMSIVLNAALPVGETVSVLVTFFGTAYQ